MPTINYRALNSATRFAPSPIGEVSGLQRVTNMVPVSNGKEGVGAIAAKATEARAPVMGLLRTGLAIVGFAIVIGIAADIAKDQIKKATGQTQTSSISIRK